MSKINESSTVYIVHSTEHTQSSMCYIFYIGHCTEHTQIFTIFYIYICTLYTEHYIHNNVFLIFSPFDETDSGTSSKGDTTYDADTVTSTNYSSDSAALTKYR